jgi:predicted nucleotidyltransferase
MPLPEDLDASLASAAVAVAWLFGSRARGDADDDSDTDIALLLRAGAPVPSLRTQGALANEFATALGVDEIDLVVLDRAPLDLRGRVLTEGRVLWSRDEPRRVRFTVETLSRYFDILPTIREQDRAYLRAVAHRGL